MSVSARNTVSPTAPFPPVAPSASTSVALPDPTPLSTPLSALPSTPLSTPRPVDVSVDVTVDVTGNVPAPSPAALLAFARAAAADPGLVASLPLDPDHRTWLRLDGPAGSEAWLIGWPPGTGTGWHDHGGSYGAFAAAAGSLDEESLAVRLPTEGWKTLELAEDVDRHRTLTVGDARAFGKHHVHEVLNRSGTDHAVSVHAYYPPLPLMRRYSRTGAVLRLEDVELPQEWR